MLMLVSSFVRPVQVCLVGSLHRLVSCYSFDYLTISISDHKVDELGVFNKHTKDTKINPPPLIVVDDNVGNWT